MLGNGKLGLRLYLTRVLHPVFNTTLFEAHLIPHIVSLSLTRFPISLLSLKAKFIVNISATQGSPSRGGAFGY